MKGLVVSSFKVVDKKHKSWHNEYLITVSSTGLHEWPIEINVLHHPNDSSLPDNLRGKIALTAVFDGEKLEFEDALPQHKAILAQSVLNFFNSGKITGIGLDVKPLNEPRLTGLQVDLNYPDAPSNQEFFVRDETNSFYNKVSGWFKHRGAHHTI